MNKRIITILLACTMCFSVLFTGCAEENENANTDINTGNNEQVSTDTVGNVDSSIGDKFEDIISDVVGRQQPSSKRITELAEKMNLLSAILKITKISCST